LTAQIFNVGETSLFWKQMPERNLTQKETYSMPDFRVCVRTLYGFHTTRSPKNAFLRTYPRRSSTHDCSGYLQVKLK